MADYTQLKQERDNANQEVKSISIENRKKINDLKQSFAKAGELKAARNKENELSADLRKKRDHAKEKIAESKKKLDEMREKMRSIEGSRNAAALQQEIDRLEWIQQTEPLNPKEEKELAKRIKELGKELPQIQGFEKLVHDFAAERDKIKKAIDDETRFHEKMVEHSKKAQELHDSLIAESKKIKALQESLSSSMQMLTEKQGAADEKHHEFVKTANEHRARQTQEHQTEETHHARAEQVHKSKLQEKAKEIYDRFKSGGKITSEDLLLLQQSGIL